MRSFKPVVEHARWWLAAALPLALLSGAVSIIVNQQPTLEGPPVFPIVRSPLEDAREVFHKGRLRHRLETEHLLSGAWPQEARADRPAGGEGADALTGGHGDAYYYAQRGNGIVLLAPER